MCETVAFRQLDAAKIQLNAAVEGENCMIFLVWGVLWERVVVRWTAMVFLVYNHDISGIIMFEDAMASNRREATFRGNDWDS